jgi:hypothetical protein
MAMKAAREIKEHYVVDESGKRVSVVLDPKVYKDLLAELKTLRANAAKPRGKNGKRRATTRIPKTTAPRTVKNELSERERVRKILRQAGMLAELTPEDKALAAKWRALPEERKQHVIRKLDSIRFTPTLSETIIRDRG